jgi:hypothetical protein
MTKVSAQTSSKANVAADEASFRAVLVLDFTITVTHFVTAIGGPFQKYDDMFGHGDTKTQRRNT